MHDDGGQVIVKLFGIEENAESLRRTYNVCTNDTFEITTYIDSFNSIIKPNSNNVIN